MLKNTTHGSGWMVQIQATDQERALLPGIPPTAVGGSFKSSLQTKNERLLCQEYHPRQWVDRSRSGYMGRTRHFRFASLPRGAGERDNKTEGSAASVVGRT